MDNYAPFYRKIFQSPSKPDTVVYRRRREFQKFSSLELDPLNRFTEEMHFAKEYFCYIWSDTSSLAGTVYEALVACHLVHSESCYYCNCRKTLRWNGGRDLTSSWADMVCLYCKTTYEIKSIASADAVEKRAHFNQWRGGSFRTFYMHPPLAKRYLVAIIRQESFHKNTNSMAHQVSIAEIDHVLPRLCYESFLPGSQNIRIASDIVTKRSTLKVWCHIKSHRAPFQQIARDVFDQTFGVGTWTNLDEVHDQDIEADAKCTLTQQKRDRQEEYDEKIDSLKQSLDLLKLANGEGDDEYWESIYAIE